MAVHEPFDLDSEGRLPATHWRHGLPDLRGDLALLREVRGTDAASLVEHLSDRAVMRYLTACPDSIGAFRRFIRWARRERRRGRFACYGIVPPRATKPVGVIQVWPVERDFSTAEWGFVIGRRYWGTGLFLQSARLFCDAVFKGGLFGPPGVYRLESRAVDANGRGNRVLEKLGAKREGVLRGAFREDDLVLDQVMWSILAADWSVSPAGN